MRTIITCPKCGACVTLSVDGIEEREQIAARLGSIVSLVELALEINGKAVRMAEGVRGDVLDDLTEANQSIVRARDRLTGEGFRCSAKDASAGWSRAATVGFAPDAGAASSLGRRAYDTRRDPPGGPALGPEEAAEDVHDNPPYRRGLPGIGG